MSQSDLDRAARLRKDFRVAFGRDMTPEEARLLLWAEAVAPSTEPDDEDLDQTADSAKAG